MGIRGGSVLVFRRPAFWIAAEVVALFPWHAPAQRTARPRPLAVGGRTPLCGSAGAFSGSLGRVFPLRSCGALDAARFQWWMSAFRRDPS